YLLHNGFEGFAFLVGTNAGWSLVRVLTGTPEVRGDRATLDGVTYRRRWSYASTVTYVLGEFYWRVEANQQARHEDFEAAEGRERLLSREQARNESTWSAGERVDPALVARAFGLDAAQAALLGRDGPPDVGQALRGGMLTWPVLLLILVIVLVMLAMCSHD